MFSSSTAFAAVQVVCNETPIVSSTYVRVTAQVGDDQSITEVAFLNWSAENDSLLGRFDGGLIRKGPVAPVVQGEQLKYHFVALDPDDVGEEEMRTDFHLALPKSLKGSGSVRMEYEKGEFGEDEFSLDCAPAP
ncbi:MAG: hypothetical protein HC902_14660 [Calothrix sp. SM1_5_4]|nr:hypothetical protein [Calothrix sp. SM1_5_4]